MTTVYGVTWVGGREQINRQLKDHDLSDGADNFRMSAYLTTLVFMSLGRIFERARNIQVSRAAPVLSLVETCDGGGGKTHPWSALSHHLAFFVDVAGRPGRQNRAERRARGLDHAHGPACGSAVLQNHQAPGACWGAVLVTLFLFFPPIQQPSPRTAGNAALTFPWAM